MLGLNKMIPFGNISCEKLSISVPWEETWGRVGEKRRQQSAKADANYLQVGPKGCTFSPNPLTVRPPCSGTSHATVWLSPQLLIDRIQMDERSGAHWGCGRLAAAPSRGKARRSRLTMAASLKKFWADEERDPEWRSPEPPHSIGPPEPFH